MSIFINSTKFAWFHQVLLRKINTNNEKYLKKILVLRKATNAIFSFCQKSLPRIAFLRDVHRNWNEPYFNYLITIIRYNYLISALKIKDLSLTHRSEVLITGLNFLELIKRNILRVFIFANILNWRKLCCYFFSAIKKTTF